MPATQYDLIVIGAGSGGIRAARVASALGARVAVIEHGPLGGTCVNVGCVPKKLLVYAAHFPALFHEASGFGWTVGATAFDWTQLIANKNRAIARLNDIYGHMLEDAGVSLYPGRAQISGPHCVYVNGEPLEARHILVATGSLPARPDIPGGELAITSNEAFFLDSLPRRIVIVGGGYIGVEFAGIFNGLGAEVIIVHRGDMFLRGFDDGCRRFLAERLTARGIELCFNTSVAEIRSHDGLQVLLDNDRLIAADQVMFATGRIPNTADLGLKQTGVRLDNRGAIQVDEHFTTSVPSIHAVGDVIDRVMLTPMAIAEGTALARRLFGDQDEAGVLDYDLIPTCIFSQPNLATVGLSETEARERGLEPVVYQSNFRPLQYSLSKEPERALVKLVVDRNSDRVLGVHMVGDEAGEIIQGFAVALQAGATKAVFDRTLGIHPTAAEEFVTLRES